MAEIAVKGLEINSNLVTRTIAVAVRANVVVSSRRTNSKTIASKATPTTSLAIRVTILGAAAKAAAVRPIRGVRLSNGNPLRAPAGASGIRAVAAATPKVAWV